MKNMTMKKAYEVFGATPKNPYWSWSGRCESKKRAVVNIWRDRLNGGVYHEVPNVNDNRPGRSELIENLIYARDYCDGLFYVVLVTELAGDATGELRSHDGRVRCGSRARETRRIARSACGWLEHAKKIIKRRRFFVRPVHHV